MLLAKSKTSRFSHETWNGLYEWFTPGSGIVAVIKMELVWKMGGNRFNPVRGDRTYRTKMFSISSRSGESKVIEVHFRVCR
jgi:hypothetical protein